MAFDLADPFADLIDDPHGGAEAAGNANPRNPLKPLRLHLRRNLVVGTALFVVHLKLQNNLQLREQEEVQSEISELAAG